MIDINTIEDLKQVLNKFEIAQNYGTDVYDRIYREISSILQNPLVSHLFQKDIFQLSEQSILSPSGEVVRPDRLVFHNKTYVSIIDYKTGEQQSEHIEQIKQYESVLKEIGYKTIDGYLIYLTTTTVKKL